MFQLVTKRRHVYGPVLRVPKEQSASRKEQFERACLHCLVVRITVIGDADPRQWRFGNGVQFVEPCGAPECDMIVNHAEPLERGGQDRPDNCVAAPESGR